VIRYNVDDVYPRMPPRAITLYYEPNDALGHARQTATNERSDPSDGLSVRRVCVTPVLRTWREIRDVGVVADWPVRRGLDSDLILPIACETSYSNEYEVRCLVIGGQNAQKANSIEPCVEPDAVLEYQRVPSDCI